MSDTHAYDDIINHERPTSGKRRMTLIERAAQFSSFAALTGYNDAIDETARVTEEKIELDEDRKAVLDNKLSSIINMPYEERSEVTITYYVPDSKKAGGSYMKLTDIIKNVNVYDNSIVMRSGDVIKVEYIVDIE